MSGYQRFIAYVYEYRKGRKANNCGFLKVEIRDRVCTVEIHLQVKGMMPKESCRVYGFLRKDGLLGGILIGNCETRQDGIECTVKTDAQNVVESEVTFGKLGGMLLLTESGGFFGTEWDDQPIRPENFKELKQVPQKPASVSKDAPAEELESRGEVEAPQVVQSASEDELPCETQPSQKAQAQPTSVPKSQQDSQLPHRAQLSSEGQNLREVQPQNVGQESSENQSRRETRPLQDLQPSREAPPRQDAQVSRDLQASRDLQVPRDLQASRGLQSPRDLQSSHEAQRSSETPSLPTQSAEAPAPVPEKDIHIQSAGCSEKKEPVTLPFGQPFCPFPDGDLTACWKIHPQDLVHFPRRQCALRNNRFLQYGYYNFGHLLLCKRADGRYILGVPGSYDQQEQFMAGMFGFSCFKESPLIKVPKGRGGYWYRIIDSPVCR